MGIKTSAEIRSTLLSQLRDDFPSWLWVAGEPQVDILDAIAEFHQERELVVELLDSMKSIAGFRRLIDDEDYRELISDTLDLSLTSRNPSLVFEGVPREVGNDLDAFIFYYLDRFAERYGRKRRRGSSAFAQIEINYTVGISGTVRMVLEYGNYLYNTSVDIDGTGTNTGLVFSFGYGTKYNTKAGNLAIKTVTGALTSAQILSFTHEDLQGGTDYQTSRAFLVELEKSVSIFSGPHSRNAISKVISEEDSVDKYLIKGAQDGHRFIGSTDVFIKGNTEAIWTASKVVQADMKVLVPYQPSSILGIYKGGALVAPTEYTITYPAATNEYIYSVQQLVWVDFTGSVVVFAADTVDFQLQVDVSVQNVHTKLLAHYATYMETSREVLTYQAQAQELDVEVELVLYRPLSQTVVEDQVSSDLTNFISNMEIEEQLETDDLRFELRKTIYNGELLVDSIQSLKIAKTGDPLLDQTLTLSRGQYWQLKNLTVRIV